MTDRTEEGLRRGDVRAWVEPSRRDPHTILRIDTLNDEVLIKYADKTTAWEPMAWYETHTRVVDL